MELNKYIDHTNLKADARKEDIIKLCNEAKTYHFKTVCLNPYWVKFASELLKDSDVEICTVIGFPLGATTTATKVFEACDAIDNGANEIDMVINIGALKDKDYPYVLDDIKKVVVNVAPCLVKVIIETCLLTKEEIIKACEICLKAQVAFVKTSTGFSTGGATVEDIKLIKEVVQNKVLIKASGGIRTKEKMLALIEAGANRIGASASVDLIK
ncbi:MAG: deoxyribose-phosphate aldolase [Bacilli bacterium]|jgi:deoxyribose-phosphate aldolase|nr:deoxyribose-phosphate aldolase [Bacilli bacterium]